MTDTVYLPFPGNEAQQRQQAARRRQALSAAGCQTYTLEMRSGYAAILCLCCGRGSINANDILQRFCGFCHAFHEEWVEDPGT